MELIEAFYRKNREKYVKKYANRAGSKEAAEDIVQEAFFRAIKFFNSYNPALPFEGWFNRIISNTLRAYKNMEKGYSNHDEFDEEDFEGTPCRMMNQRLYEQVKEEISHYDEEYYEILSLYFEYQYQPRDICKIVDMKYKTVETIIQRFKRLIKEKYGEKL